MVEVRNHPLAKLEYNVEKNTLYFRVKQDITLDVNEIQEMIFYVKEFIGEKRHYAIVDFGSNLGSSTEARKLYAEDPYLIKYRIADAFLVKSLALRLIANFFINVTKPKIHTKLFTSELEAEKWLEHLRIGA